MGCTVSAPLQERLQELAKLYGQYSVHTLCEALCVSRGTFYNHIFRRKEVTAYDKRRAEMREHIKAVFDESYQRFGANKIAAVLSEQGIHISPKYTAELMREMGLQSVTLYSKRDYQKRERLGDTIRLQRLNLPCNFNTLLVHFDCINQRVDNH